MGRRTSPKLTGREKSERVEQFVPLLSAVSDPVVRNDAAQRIADAFRLEFETVWSRVRGKASTAAGARTAAPGPAAGAEEDKFLHRGDSGKVHGGAAGAAAGGVFRGTGLQNNFFYHKKQTFLTGPPIDFQQVATHLRGEAELNLLSELTLSEDIDDQILQRIDENLLPMERRYVDRRKLEIQRDIVEAERQRGWRTDRRARSQRRWHPPYVKRS